MRRKRLLSFIIRDPFFLRPCSDIHSSAITVEEALFFSAKLRLSSNNSNAQVDTCVPPHTTLMYDSLPYIALAHFRHCRRC